MHSCALFSLSYFLNLVSKLAPIAAKILCLLFLLTNIPHDHFCLAWPSFNFYFHYKYLKHIFCRGFVWAITHCSMAGHVSLFFSSKKEVSDNMKIFAKYGSNSRNSLKAIKMKRNKLLKSRPVHFSISQMKCVEIGRGACLLD